MKPVTLTLTKREIHMLAVSADAYRVRCTIRAAAMSGDPEAAAAEEKEARECDALRRKLHYAYVGKNTDARLIAAAPDLLEACKGLLMELKSFGVNVTAIDYAEEVIARAERRED